MNDWIGISAYILMLDRFRDTHFKLQKLKKDKEL